MSVLARLKEETKSLHEMTEALLLGPRIMSGELTLTDYKLLLAVNVAFHAPLEAAIREYAGFFAGYEPVQRRKTPHLLTDIKAIDDELPEIDMDFFRSWTPYQLLGATYVAEGSTLGSRFISNALKKNHNLPEAAQHSVFYEGYGPETGSRWQTFRGFLPELASGHEDDVVDGALTAFRTYRELFLSLSAPVA
nr:biliverdin-producing heme oxygenase [uncultured Arsenicibacter sp.]